MVNLYSFFLDRRSTSKDIIAVKYIYIYTSTIYKSQIRQVFMAYLTEDKTRLYYCISYNSTLNHPSTHSHVYQTSPLLSLWQTMVRDVVSRTKNADDIGYVRRPCRLLWLVISVLPYSHWGTPRAICAVPFMGNSTWWHGYRLQPAKKSLLHQNLFHQPLWRRRALQVHIPR